MEVAITSGSLPKLATQLRQELAALAATDYSSNGLLQLKKQSLIIDMMHSCNVVEGLLAPEDGPGGTAGPAAAPTSTKDWAWSRQLRYYADAVSFWLQGSAVNGNGRGPSWLNAQGQSQDFHP